MTPLAGDWWASGAFWQFVITTLVGITVGFMGAWATLRAGNPKRQVRWSVVSNTPLIPDSLNGGTHAPDTVPVVAVTFLGIPLRKPRIIEISIFNHGRRDITAETFHRGESMRLDLGVDVCAILDVTTNPDGTVKPEFDHAAWTVSGGRHHGETWLDLRPSLLRGDQRVVVTLLVDGDSVPARLAAAPLVEVEVTGHGGWGSNRV